jgi:hypothetical protein
MRIFIKQTKIYQDIRMGTPFYKLLLFIFIPILNGCSYKIVRNYESITSLSILKRTNPLIVKHKDLFGLNISYRGSIKLDDTGFTIDCSETDAIILLKEEARKINSNLINIIDEAYPGTSSCYRCVADFFKADFDSLTLSILNNPERKLKFYDSLNQLNWSDFRLDLDDTCSNPYTIYSNFRVISGRTSFWDGSYKNFTVRCLIYTDVSMVKKSFMTDGNLTQVQLQFDLNQLYAKKLENYLNSEKFGSGNSIKVQLELDKCIKELEQATNKFIKDTDYGKNRLGQRFWREKINKEFPASKK